MPELNVQVSRATKWSSITETVVRCIAPVTNIILARLLTPEAFGVVATVTMIVSFADMFTDAGFQKFLVQHEFNSEKELEQGTTVAFWTNFLISGLIWISICLARDSLAGLVGNEGLGNAIGVASFSLPLTSFSSIQMARFKRNFEYKSLFLIRIVSAVIPFVVTIPVAVMTHSFWALIIGTIAGNLSNAVLLSIKSQWKPRLFYSFRILKEMFSYSWWILLESIAVWMTSYIGTFIVGFYLSAYYLGLYKTAMTSVNNIISLITASTSMPLFAALSRLQGKKKELENMYCSYMQAIAIVVIPMGVGIYIFQDFVTKVLLGEQWMEAAPFIGLLGITSSVTTVLGTYANNLFNAAGKTYISFLAQILHLIVLIPVLIWSAARGFDTLCLSRSLVRLEIIFVEMILLKIIVRFPVIKIFKAVVPASVGTAFMSVIALFVQKLGGEVYIGFIEVIACIIFYFAFMYIFYKKALVDSLKVFGLSKERI